MKNKTEMNKIPKNILNVDKLTPIRGVEELFDRYIHQVFIPEVEKRFKQAVTDVGGDLMWKFSKLVTRKIRGTVTPIKFNAFFATPHTCGGGDINTIHLQFEDNYGIVDTIECDFPVNDWSMDVDTDIYNYIQFLELTIGIKLK